MASEKRTYVQGSSIWGNRFPRVVTEGGIYILEIWNQTSDIQEHELESTELRLCLSATAREHCQVIRAK